LRINALKLNTGLDAILSALNCLIHVLYKVKLEVLSRVILIWKWLVCRKRGVDVTSLVSSSMFHIYSLLCPSTIRGLWPIEDVLHYMDINVELQKTLVLSIQTLSIFGKTWQPSIKDCLFTCFNFWYHQYTRIHRNWSK